MKTFILSAIILLSLNLQSRIDFKNTTKENPFPAGLSWEKSDKAVWKGNNNMWYKIDKKNLCVKLSCNKKKWTTGSNSIWMDYQGNYLFIYDNKLVTSEDGSKWTTVQDNTWQGIDGNWYKFDEGWNLLQAKNSVNQKDF